MEQIHLSILNVLDPVTFWVRAASSEQRPEERLPFQTLQRELTYFCENDVVQTRHTSFNKNQMVAVRSVRERIWSRGVVEGSMESSHGCKLMIFLIDEGVTQSIPLMFVRDLPEEFQNIPAQAIKFQLSDVVPLTMVMETVDYELKPVMRVCDSWDPAALILVRKLISEHQRAWAFNLHTRADVDRQFYGSLCLYMGQGCVVCLNEELIRLKYAAMPPRHQAVSYPPGSGIESSSNIASTPETTDPKFNIASTPETTDPKFNIASTPETTDSSSNIASTPKPTDPISNIALITKLKVSSSNIDTTNTTNSSSNIASTPKPTDSKSNIVSTSTNRDVPTSTMLPKTAKITKATELPKTAELLNTAEITKTTEFTKPTELPKTAEFQPKNLASVINSKRKTQCKPNLNNPVQIDSEKSNSLPCNTNLAPPLAQELTIYSNPSCSTSSTITSIPNTSQPPSQTPETPSRHADRRVSFGYVTTMHVSDIDKSPKITTPPACVGKPIIKGIYPLLAGGSTTKLNGDLENINRVPTEEVCINGDSLHNVGDLEGKSGCGSLVQNREHLKIEGCGVDKEIDRSSTGRGRNLSAATTGNTGSQTKHNNSLYNQTRVQEGLEGKPKSCDKRFNNNSTCEIKSVALNGLLSNVDSTDGKNKTEPKSKDNSASMCLSETQDGNKNTIGVDSSTSSPNDQSSELCAIKPGPVTFRQTLLGAVKSSRRINQSSTCDLLQGEALSLTAVTGITSPQPTNPVTLNNAQKPAISGVLAALRNIRSSTH